MTYAKRRSTINAVTAAAAATRVDAAAAAAEASSQQLRVKSGGLPSVN